jgi:tetratricopeptide (TPR) repeat protein
MRLHPLTRRENPIKNECHNITALYLTPANPCARLLPGAGMNYFCAVFSQRSARIFTVSLLLFFSCSAVFAQTADPTDPRALENFPITYRTALGTAVVIFRVYAERTGTHLDRQALVKLVNVTSGSETWQTTDSAGQGFFTNVTLGKYELEVSAVGYLAAHQTLNATDSMQPSQVSIVLQRDPNAVNLDVAGAIMSAKARKDAKHAISQLKSGKLAGAEKQLERAYALSPSSPELNFLLGYLHFKLGNFEKADTYLASATNLNPHNGQALTLLGRSRLERKDYPAAKSALERAVLEDAENWIPHDLLANTYLFQRKYDQARNEAETALNKGKSQASPARLVLGQALIGLGHGPEGVQELNKFLVESPKHPLVGQVRSLIAEVGDGGSSPSTTAISTLNASSIDTLRALPPPSLPSKPWQPPGVDDVKPPVAATTVCSTSRVIEESGKRVEELVDDVAKFAAIEELSHQALDNYGVPIRTETRRFDYVATISEPQPGILTVDEYREQKLTLQGFPDKIASTGFAALALVFHPDIRDTFEIACEGLGEWQQQPTWLMHFRQRPDRPNRIHSYNVGSQTHSVGLKGRAWITADKFQIVRMEAEMIKPMPEIQLLSEHQIVEYGPVPFAKRNTTLWLPKSAEIYFDFRKHRYYRRHSFDHYMLFAVDSQEKRKEPVAKPEDSAGTKEKNPS